MKLARIHCTSADEVYELLDTAPVNIANVPDETLARWRRVLDEYKTVQKEMWYEYTHSIYTHNPFCMCAGCQQ